VEVSPVWRYHLRSVVAVGLQAGFSIERCVYLRRKMTQTFIFSVKKPGISAKNSARIFKVSSKTITPGLASKA
jgi:hypothetical protein